MLSPVKATENVKANPTASSASSAARKRQRRQAAAAFLFPTATATTPTVSTVGRKSTAQPRPAVHVPPRGIGPIVEPNVNDVLCGRGGRINSHSGNIQFRDMVSARKKEYLAKTTKKLEKAHIAAKIVEEIRSMDPPGRFLKEDSDTGLWWDIGDQKAIKKSGQALREDAPDLRHELGGEGDDPDSGDNDETKKTTKKEEGAPKKEPKRSETPTDKKVAASVTPTSGPKIQIPKAMQGVATNRPEVKTPVTNNHSERNDQTAAQKLPPAGTSSENVATQQQNLQTPQLLVVNDPNAGMAYADYLQRFQSQQPQLVMPSGQQFMIIPFPQAQQQVNTNQTSAATSNNNARDSPNIYSYPAQLFQGAKSFAQKATKYSEKASEVMQSPQPHPFNTAVAPGGNANNVMMMGRRPPSNVAFGRAFYPPTELSSGSTMSTISGLSSVMNPEGSLLSLSSYRSHGMGGGTVLSGLEFVDQQQQQQQMQQQQQQMQQQQAVAVARANSLRTAQMMQDQRRLSQLSDFRGTGSDLTFSLRSLGSISRSHSFPDLSNSIREEMRMFDESFANNNNSNNLPTDMSLATATMASSTAPGRDTSPVTDLSPTNDTFGTPQHANPGDAAANVSPTGMGTTPAGRSSSRRPPAASNRSVSTASAMSLSMASISLSATSRGSTGLSELSWNRFPIPDDSNRSIFSDLSNDIVALDLAGPPRRREDEA